MKVQFKHFYKWNLVWCLFFILVLFFLSGVDFQMDFGTIHIAQKKTFVEILLNNSYNYFLYFILFPINIVVATYEFLTLAVNIYAGYKVYGLEETISLLLPHALLELPNILFYSFLSFHMFNAFWKNSMLSTLTQTVLLNWRCYIISYLILILAAWIVGNIS